MISRSTLALLSLLAMLAGACNANAQSAPPADDFLDPQPTEQRAAPPAEGHAAAYFAGGCFWCMEGPFEALPGVVEVWSGYAGGSTEYPTYHRVANGETDFVEAVRVEYDPATVTYAALLEIFWKTHDPTDAEGQFADRGPHYRPVIWVQSEEERAAAESSKQALAESGVFGDEAIVVPIEDFDSFWYAEEYHQDYYLKNPGHYNSYRRLSGRTGFLRRHWGDEAH